MFIPATGGENQDSPARRIWRELSGRDSSVAAVILPLLLTAALLGSPFLSPPSLASAADVYSYTDENGVLVITNTPLPEKMKGKARKIDSHKKITDEDRKAWEKEREDRMRVWRDAQAAEEESAKRKPEAPEAAKPESLQRMEAESAAAAKSAREAKEKALDVLKALTP